MPSCDCTAPSGTWGLLGRCAYGNRLNRIAVSVSKCAHRAHLSEGWRHFDAHRAFGIDGRRHDPDHGERGRVQEFAAKSGLGLDIVCAGVRPRVALYLIGPVMVPRSPQASSICRHQRPQPPLRQPNRKKALDLRWLTTMSQSKRPKNWITRPEISISELFTESSNAYHDY